MIIFQSNKPIVVALDFLYILQASITKSVKKVNEWLNNKKSEYNLSNWMPLSDWLRWSVPAAVGPTEVQMEYHLVTDKYWD